MKVIAVAFILSFSIALASCSPSVTSVRSAASSRIGGSPSFPHCAGSPTGKAPIDTALKLVGTSRTGKLFHSGSAPDNVVPVLHAYGTPYEMGLAQGELLKKEVNEVYTLFYEWVDTQIDPFLKFLPKIIREAIEKGGVKAGLDVTGMLTRKFTPERFLEEMRGIADGAGVDYESVVRIAMFPELVKAACSMAGAWGPATVDGRLIQLRALDWGYLNPLRNHPLVVVYHPNAGHGHPFAQLGWTGFVGALTGYSSHGAVCEKVWIHYKGASSREGIPWTFLLRDILQFDSNLDEAIARVKSADRTCSIFLGLGSVADNEFRVVEYSHTTSTVFNDSSPFPGYAPTPKEHPLFKGLVYVDKHSQPSSDPCMASILTKDHGTMSSQSLIDLVARFQTGDLHAAVFDFKDNAMFVSVASQLEPWPAKDPSTVIPAYNRQFIRLNMTEQFATPL